MVASRFWKCPPGSDASVDCLPFSQSCWRSAWASVSQVPSSASVAGSWADAVTHSLRLGSFVRFDLSVGRTSAVDCGNFIGLELAFARNFIDYFPCSYVNFSS